MNSPLLSYYEAIERASADMLSAARAGDWDLVVRLEGACVLLISQLLFNKGITRQAIGRSTMVCTYTSSRDRQCNGTYFLPKGKIVVSGSMRYRGFYKLAVVGGTDLYNNVRGSVSGTMLARGPRRELLVFRLIA